MNDEVVREEFEVGPQPQLTLSNVSGQVTIVAGSDTTIRLSASKQGSRRAVENTRIEIDHQGSHLRVETRGDKSGLLQGMSRSVAGVDYELIVPSGTHVNVRAVSADISLKGTAAPCHLQSVSGDVALENISGDCRVTTVSGDIDGQNVSGRASVRTTSGDARFEQSSLNHFNLNSISGDFRVETALASGQHYLANTVSGDLLLLVPANTGATVQMKTVSGDVISDLPGEVIKAGKRQWQGRINGGGATVEVASVSGDLRISPLRGSSESPSLSESARTQPPESSEHTGPLSQERTGTNDVLTALERGEISVEEAMSQLGARR